MIKVFRKIRQELIDRGELRKYLLYAIGEIFLIMAGILIALQINNLNDSKQKRQKEIVYLKEIKENLENNLKNDIIPGIIKTTKSVQSFNSFHTTLKNPSFDKNIDSVIGYLWDITNPNDIVLNTVGFDNLTSTGIDLISNDSLKTSIATLYGYHYKHLAELDDAHHIFTRQIIWPMIQNNINFSHYEITDEELNFLQTNGSLYSKLTGNTYDLSEILGYLKFLKPRIEQLILDIEHEINQ